MRMRPLRRARRRVAADLAADPYLKWILLLSAVLVTFWLWHRIPNFATRDERWRVVDPVETAGALLDGFSFEALAGGMDFWRPFGATFYVYALVEIPMFAAAWYAGEIGRFAEVIGLRPDFFGHWQSLAEWMWWGAILPSRLVNAALVVACVYVIYRIGTRLRDRRTGRLSAILLAVTWAMVFLGHEAGEDVPMLFCLLVVFYLALDYVETGSPRSFLWGCAVGGLAIAFKLTGGLSAVLLGVAYLLRVSRAEDRRRALVPAKVGAVALAAVGGLAAGFVLFGTPGVVVSVGLVGVVTLWPAGGRATSTRSSPRGWLSDRAVVGWLSHPDVTRSHALVLAAGPVVALVVVFLGFPTAVANGLAGLEAVLRGEAALVEGLYRGPKVIVDRVARGVGTKASPHGWLDRPVWWWFVRGSLNGLGWPLFVASVVAVVVSAVRLLPGLAGAVRSRSRARDRPLATDGVVLALVGVAVIVAIYSTWEYFRTHHLLPALALAVLLVGLSLRDLIDRRETAGTVLAAALILSTAVYAGVGTLGYATDPRDGAVNYVAGHAGPNATVETYARDSQEAAVPHGMTIYRPTDRDTSFGEEPPRDEWLTRIEGRCPEFVVLNYQRSMIWLAPENHSALADRWGTPQAAAYLRDLLRDGPPYETENAPYPYEVAERFGPRPVFRETGKPIDPTWDVLRAGLFPRTIQYGDPQDFGVYGYAVVLERSGQCDGATDPR